MYGLYKGIDLISDGGFRIATVTYILLALPDRRAVVFLIFFY